jgi:membrane associated rhomboid family serine protease
MPMIDNWGHLGGLLAGIILTWTLGPRIEISITPDEGPRLVDQRPWQKVRPYTLIAIVMLILLAFAASQSPFT